MSEQTPIRPRLWSLDAYRGLVMLAMASGGLGIAAAAKHYPDSDVWQAVAHQFEHVTWVGCTLWDLIQPSFMYMVGTAMAFSYANRQAQGQSYGRMFFHAAIRSIVLILLGVFLRSNGHPQTIFTFIDVLTQIGLGYTFLFLLWGKHPAWQALAAVAILGLYGAWFYFTPAPSADIDRTTVGWEEEYQPLGGRSAHWNKNTNPAANADVWLLNRLPREQPFDFEGGGYQTLNFIPSLATMIFGLLAGEWLRKRKSAVVTLSVLVAAGLAGVAAGLLLDRFDICPLVKRIWTPSWAVFSAGCATLILAAFYLLVDVWGWRRVAWPLVVVGANSIVMYVMAQTIGRKDGWIERTLATHFGKGLFTLYGRLHADFEPMMRAGLVLFCMWLVCAWLYRQRLLVRI